MTDVRKQRLLEVIYSEERAVDRREVEEEQEYKSNNNTTDPASLRLTIAKVIDGDDTVRNFSRPSRHS